MVNAVDPDQIHAGDEPEPDRPQSPYQQIAARPRARIGTGQLALGDTLPSLNELMREHDCPMGTAHRAVTPLAEEHLEVTRRGFRATVASPEH